MTILISMLLIFLSVLANQPQAQSGFSVGLQGTYNLPLGKFSEVKEGFYAGRDMASPTLGFGITIKYGIPFLSNSLGFRGDIEYLQMDDKSKAFDVVRTDEFGNEIGRSHYEFRIISALIDVQYYPFSKLPKINPYAGVGLGAYFYSYVNTGYVSQFTPRTQEEFTRLGLNFNLGSEFSLYRRWSLDVSIHYHLVFLQDGDRIGPAPAGSISKLQYFQIESGILYNLNIF